MDRRPELIDGETIEERDSEAISETLTNIKELRNLRDGLPKEEIITEGELIPLRSTLAATASYSAADRVDVIRILAPDSALHIALVRKQVIAAIGLEEPKEVIEDIKKKAA